MITNALDNIGDMSYNYLKNKIRKATDFICRSGAKHHYLVNRTQYIMK